MSSFVVTGASRGLGYEFICQLAANRANTVIGLVRDKASTDKRLQADKITNATILQADICDLSALEAAANETKKLTGGSLDYLINNAGYISKISGLKTLVELENPQVLEEDLQKSFNINVIGVIKTINAFLPLILVGRTKKVITVTSGMADSDLINNYGISFAAPYSISKAGINTAMAKYNAALGRSRGVLFMGISPGYVDTGNASQAKVQEEQDPEILKRSQELGSQFALYAPHFTGAATPESSVKAVIGVIERSSVQNGDGGTFVSHFGNKQWL